MSSTESQSELQALLDGARRYPTPYEIADIEREVRAMRAAALAQAMGALAGLPAALWRAVLRWRTAAATRRELMALDERTLKDIGIGRLDIHRIVAGGWLGESRPLGRDVGDLPAADRKMGRAA